MFGETENPPESENLEPASNTEESSSEQPKPQDLLELDSVEKFRYGGREWTPKDLSGAILMQSDYTKKTQAIAEERRYYDNLSIDLAEVKRNPWKAEQFKQVYPEKFHSYLDHVIEKQQSLQNQQPTQQQQGVDPAFMREFQEMKSEMHERKVQAIEAELNSTFDTMGKKYPFADPNVVLARGQSMHETGEKLSTKVWENLFKSENERLQKLADQYYSKRVKEQKSANLKGRDVASGGGVPGQEPRRPKTIREASRFALEELEGT